MDGREGKTVDGSQSQKKQREGEGQPPNATDPAASLAGKQNS